MNASENKLSNRKFWYCDSGASCYITWCKNLLSEYKEFSTPEVILLGKAGTSMKAFGTGNIRLQSYHSGKWHTSYLANVRYVPEASANLYSAKAAALNGFETVLNNKGVVVRRKKYNAVVATGKIRNNLFAMNFKIPKYEEFSSARLATTSDTLQTYHERLGHQNKKHVKEILSRMNIPVKDEKESVCDGCAIGKMHRLPFRSRPNRATKTGEIIHADLNGPIKVSRRSSIFFLNTFLKETKTKGHIIKSFRCDGGKEFDNICTREILSEFGVELLIGPPYSPQQNGSAERENRTIVEAARSMLNSCGLPKSLWAEACSTAVYLLNLTGKSSEPNKTPFEIWYNKKVLNLNHLRIFGTPCYVHIPKQKRLKFDDKASAGHMVGYVNERDGYRVWIPKFRIVICTHDVKFKPERPCTAQSVSENPDDIPETPKIPDNLEKSRTSIIVENLESEHFQNPEPSALDTHESEISEIIEDSESEPEDCRNERLRGRPEILRSGKPGRPRKIYRTPKLPIQKRSVMSEEIKSILKNDTWELIDRPADKEVIRSRMVLINKYRADGTFERSKARLVARGFSQKPGIHFHETFAPVARLGTIRLANALAAKYGMAIKQLDIASAFLQGKLQETVLMKPLERLEEILEIILNDRKTEPNIRRKAEPMLQKARTGNTVCLMRKSLYGLRQAGRCWNIELNSALLSFGAKPTKSDPCL
ncbi:UNVERIFIED_CONTAM: hypothetical protein PYX00_000010 [Menopon gallinae]|uniref:Integrase catalytic domain-containing protein n=1 Tax=Menopon gallinae TaxID=328185 RepID=A0AAW2I878_9NEOP